MLNPIEEEINAVVLENFIRLTDTDQNTFYNLISYVSNYNVWHVN